MNRIEQLIQHYCPDGVEYVQIKDIAKCSMGEFVHKSKQDPNAPYPVYNGGISNTGYYKDFNSDENKVIVSARGAGAGFVNLIEQKFWAGNSCHVLSILDAQITSYKYLFYVLKGYEKELIGSQQKGGIPAVSKTQIETTSIPLPPLPIQEEIARILDVFTELQAELQAELQKRLQQYNYYRDNLLSFEGRDDVKWKKLGEICSFMNGKGHEQSIVEYGKYIVVNSKFISTQGCVKKYSDIQISPLFVDDVLMVMSDLPNGRALAKCFIVDRNNLYTLNQRICSLTVKNKKELLAKYLFYITNRNRQLLKFDNGVDQTNLKKEDILNIIVPVPSLQEQQSIVDTLDRFDTLTNDLTAGLPAEIEKRRQQYEYYRDKLLTFKRKEA